MQKCLLALQQLCNTRKPKETSFENYDKGPSCLVCLTDILWSNVKISSVKNVIRFLERKLDLLQSKNALFIFSWFLFIPNPKEYHAKLLKQA